MQEQTEEKVLKVKNTINFRLFLFAALFLAFGIFLYCKIRLGGLRPSDFCFMLFFVFFALRPFKIKRIAALAVLLAVLGGLGAGLMHGYAARFLSGEAEGENRVTGTVISFAEGGGYWSADISELTFDGKSTGGKCRVRLSGSVRTGDVIRFTAQVKRVPLPRGADGYGVSLFTSDVRYTAIVSEFEKIGRSNNFFHALNAALYDSLHANMSKDGADISYALLTGNSRGMEEGISENFRRGGIAHIFAVSGLHIGILFGAVMLICKPLGRYRFLPALALAVCYSALCGFTVSSVRAVVMCGIVGAWNAFGRKTDFLQSISLAALIVLLASPAQWLSAGFRLSFGACLGLALFSGSFSRAFGRLPKFLGGYLSANLSVQIFTFPVLLEAFGYFSVWGTVLNFFLIPALPVLFLGLLVCALFSLVIPPAAAFFLLVPEGMISLLLFVFSFADLSFVLAGFSLGAGAVVWLVGCVALSERFRLTVRVRAVAAASLAVLFAVCVTLQNAVFVGVKLQSYSRGYGHALLVRTSRESVLVIDGEISLSDCRDFLTRTYGGRLTAAIVLSSDEMPAINVAAFLSADCIHAREEIETGLQKTEVVFGEEFSVGQMKVRYESNGKLVLFAESVAVEVDFEQSQSLGADLFIGKDSGGRSEERRVGKECRL